jgi:hypothetical protein
MRKTGKRHLTRQWDYQRYRVALDPEPFPDRAETFGCFALDADLFRSNPQYPRNVCLHSRRMLCDLRTLRNKSNI